MKFNNQLQRPRSLRMPSTRRKAKVAAEKANREQAPEEARARAIAIEEVEEAQRAINKDKREINANTKALSDIIHTQEDELAKLKNEIEHQTEEIIKLDAKWIARRSKKKNVHLNSDEADWKTLSKKNSSMISELKAKDKDLDVKEQKKIIKLMGELKEKDKELDAKDNELHAQSKKLKMLEESLKLESQNNITLKSQIIALNSKGSQRENEKQYKRFEDRLQLERRKNKSLETQIANIASSRIDEEVDDDDNTYVTKDDSRDDDGGNSIDGGDDGGNSIAQAGCFSMLFRSWGDTATAACYEKPGSLCSYDTSFVAASNPTSVGPRSNRSSGLCPHAQTL